MGGGWSEVDDENIVEDVLIQGACLQHPRIPKREDSVLSPVFDARSREMRPLHAIFSLTSTSEHSSPELKVVLCTSGLVHGPSLD